MRFGSVCSGIEAASVAWEPLGWKAAWFSEIAPFPSKFLAQRFPQVPNHGSLVGLADRLVGGDRDIDLLVGGTPCQAFSVAGLRGGLADERGNLTLEFARLAAALRPRWVVWENVPGVLSADGGRAFASLVRGLSVVGYGLAWRVLDAQFFGVAQRRERVFLVGHLGAAAAAGAVLFEPEGVRRNPPTRGKTGEEVAGTLGGGSGSRGWCSDTDRTTFVPEVASTLKTAPLRSNAGDTFVGEVSTGNGVTTEGFAPALTRSALTRCINNDTPLLLSSFDETQALTKSGRPPSIAVEIDTAPALTATAEARSTDRGVRVVCATGEVTHALRAIGADASEDGTGRGTPIVPAYSLRSDAGRVGVAKTPSADADGRVRLRDPGFNVYEEVAPTLDCGAPHSVSGPRDTRVRRLTPRECERLQGFPDDWTAIDGAKDSPRYAALGNSKAVPVVQWIGRRIALVDALLREVA